MGNVGREKHEEQNRVQWKTLLAYRVSLYKLGQDSPSGRDPFPQAHGLVTGTLLYREDKVPLSPLMQLICRANQEPGREGPELSFGHDKHKASVELSIGHLREETSKIWMLVLELSTEKIIDEGLWRLRFYRKKRKRESNLKSRCPKSQYHWFHQNETISLQNLGGYLVHSIGAYDKALPLPLCLSVFL